jgi:hypothetical protein
MKELLSTICRTIVVHGISRYGVLGEREIVTVAMLPRRGVYSSLIGRSDIRTEPTPDLTQGLFVVESKKRGRYTLQNETTGVVLSNVPRRSIRKILEWEE